MPGDELMLLPEHVRADAERRQKHARKGHAYFPGTGPEGETCKSCKHYVLRHFAKVYRKCGLMRAHWTGGPGSDIRAKDPACKFWEPNHG